MKSNDEIFEGKTFEDLSRDIYDNQKNKKLQLDLLIQEIHGMIQTLDDAVLIAPLVKELFKRHSLKGGSIFLSTHSLEIAEELCDEIAIILNGSLKIIGDMESLRKEASLHDSDLEEVFLQLTDTEDLSKIITALKDMNS